MRYNITTEDLLLLEDTRFLLAKAKILKKIEELFILTRSELKNFIDEYPFVLPEEINLSTDKISKGENYLGLPYLVLDFPAFFSNGNIFAYRTMFWWGNFFSFTLHLQGKSFEKYRHKLIEKFDNLQGQNIYICINETPWQYYYKDDNYVPLNDSHKKNITCCNFLKLSKKIDLKDWEMVPCFSKEFLVFILSVIK